jgi:hypothetical protein
MKRGPVGPRWKFGLLPVCDACRRLPQSIQRRPSRARHPLHILGPTAPMLQDPQQVVGRDDGWMLRRLERCLVPGSSARQGQAYGLIGLGFRVAFGTRPG